MNSFVHGKMNHFYMDEIDGEGNDLGGSSDEPLEEEHQEQEEHEDDTVIVTLGDEPPAEEVEQEAQAPAWVKELRKSHRELQKENRELKQKVSSVAPVNAAPVLGPKPKLEDCEYDTDKYDTALGQWYEQKRQVDDAESRKKVEEQTAQQAWQQTLNNYGEAKSKLKVRDFDDAESAVDGILSETQRGIILHITANPAQMIYALGKNPTEAKRLAAITDPVKYAGAIGALETKLKVTPRKAPPPESGNIRGSGSISGSVDSTLDRLRAEAEKTGDMTKVVAYKRSKKQAG